MSHKIEVGTLYSVINNLETYSEQSRWNRFNALLLVDSVIIVAWTTLFSIKDNRPMVLLVALSLVGILLGPIWGLLGRRSSKYQNAMHNAGKDLEKEHIEFSLPKPYTLIHDIEEKMKNKWYTKGLSL